MDSSVQMIPNILARVGILERKTCAQLSMRVQLLEDDVADLQRVNNIDRGFSVKAKHSMAPDEGLAAHEGEPPDEDIHDEELLVLVDAPDQSSQATTAFSDATEPATPEPRIPERYALDTASPITVHDIDLQLDAPREQSTSYMDVTEQSIKKTDPQMHVNNDADDSDDADPLGYVAASYAEGPN